jgi:hypothetical protein
MGLFSRKQETATTEQAAIDRLVDTLLGLPPESQMAIARLVERLVPSLAKEKDSVESLPWGIVGGALKEAVLKIAPKLITPERCWGRVKAAWSRRMPEVQGRIHKLGEQIGEKLAVTEATGEQP